MAATKKAANKPVQAAKAEKVEPTKAKGVTEANEATTAPAEAINEPEVKVYNFISENKYLTVTALGVQFMDGKASTTDLAVARALATIDGVERVKD